MSGVEETQPNPFGSNYDARRQHFLEPSHFLMRVQTSSRILANTVKKFFYFIELNSGYNRSLSLGQSIDFYELISHEK